MQWMIYVFYCHAEPLRMSAQNSFKCTICTFQVWLLLHDMVICALMTGSNLYRCNALPDLVAYTKSNPTVVEVLKTKTSVIFVVDDVFNIF